MRSIIPAAKQLQEGDVTNPDVVADSWVPSHKQ